MRSRLIGVGVSACLLLVVACDADDTSQPSPGPSVTSGRTPTASSESDHWTTEGPGDGHVSAMLLATTVFAATEGSQWTGLPGVIENPHSAESQVDAAWYRSYEEANYLDTWILELAHRNANETVDGEATIVVDEFAGTSEALLAAAAARQYGPLVKETAFQQPVFQTSLEPDLEGVGFTLVLETLIVTISVTDPVRGQLSALRDVVEGGWTLAQLSVSPPSEVKRSESPGGSGEPGLVRGMTPGSDGCPPQPTGG